MKHLILPLGALIALWALCTFFDGLVYRVCYSDVAWRLSERWGLGW